MIKILYKKIEYLIYIITLYNNNIKQCLNPLKPLNKH